MTSPRSNRSSGGGGGHGQTSGNKQTRSSRNKSTGQLRMILPSNSFDSEEHSTPRSLEFTPSVTSSASHSYINSELHTPLNLDRVGWMSPVNVPALLPNSFKTPVKLEDTSIEDREAADVLMAMTTQSSCSSSISPTSSSFTTTTTTVSTSTPATPAPAFSLFSSSFTSTSNSSSNSATVPSLNQKRGFVELSVCTQLTSLEPSTKRCPLNFEDAQLTPHSTTTTHTTTSSCYDGDGDNSNFYFSPKKRKYRSEVEVGSDTALATLAGKEGLQLTLNVLADIAAEQLTSPTLSSSFSSSSFSLLSNSNEDSNDSFTNCDLAVQTLFGFNQS